jgi:hypothetical protein
MFTNISWASYILVVSLLLAAWYLIIGMRFYFHDLQNLLARKRKPNLQLAPDETYSTTGSEFISEQTEASDADNLFHEVENLTAKLKETIADASSKNYHKEEFIFLLQLTLKEYPHLKGSPYQIAISNLIASECEKYGSLHLSAEEQVMLWKEVA